MNLILNHLNILLSSLGPWSPLVFILVYALVPVLFIPGTVMTLIGGLVFGFYWGFLYSIIGATLGAALAFLAGRYLAKNWIEKQKQILVLEIKKNIEKDGWSYIAFTRLVPIFPYSILNYVFGMTNIPLHVFAITSFICLIPGTIAYTYIGHVGQEAAKGSEHLLLEVSLALALLLIINFLSRKIKLQKTNN